MTSWLLVTLRKVTPIVLVGLCLTACSSRTARVQQTSIIPKDVIDPANAVLDVQDLGMKIAWRQTAAVGDVRHAVRKVYLDKATFFIETQDAHLSAYEVSNGVQLWIRALAGPLFCDPVTSEGYVFVLVANRLLLIKRLGGIIEREDPPRAAVSVMTAPNDKELFVGTGDARLIAVDVAGRKVKWNTGVQAPVLTPPLVFDRTVVVAGFKGSVTGLSRETGTRIWSFDPKDGEFTRGICTDGKVVYAAATDLMLYAFDPANGAILWQYPVGSLADQNPIFAAGRLFIFTYGRGLCAFDPDQKGKESWNQPEAATFITASAKYVYVLLKSGRLAALDGATGKVVWQRPLPPETLVVPDYQSETIVLATKSGYIVALRELKELQ